MSEVFFYHFLEENTTMNGELVLNSIIMEPENSGNEWDDDWSDDWSNSWGPDGGFC